jgi:hypothetical protein
MTTQAVFQSTVIAFLNENMPKKYRELSKLSSATVIQQSLINGTRLLRRYLQEKSELKIDMIVDGIFNERSEGEMLDFQSWIGNFPEDNELDFQEKLGEVSSFFRAEFAYAATEGNNTPSRARSVTSEAGPSVGTIIGILAGIALVSMFIILFVIRYRTTNDEEEPNAVQEVELLSWSSESSQNEVEGMPRYTPSLPSPTESEVYFTETPAMRSKLSPIAEHLQSRLSECDVKTPLNENTTSRSTPKGTRFMQLNFEHSKSEKFTTKRKTSKILGDLEDMEGEWEGQLESKVDSVSETPKQNNLEKFKVGTRDFYDKSKRFLA